MYYFEPSDRDIMKMEEYFHKCSNPRVLARTVGKIDKAKSRYFISCAIPYQDGVYPYAIEWANECERYFRMRCIELGVSEVELDDLKNSAQYCQLYFRF